MTLYDKYLTNLFSSFPQYTLSDKDKRIISHGLETWILNKVIRKKFRKYHINDRTIQMLSSNISESIRHNKPLHFILCFGGYKHFWNPSHPVVDWAEAFNIRYMCEYVAPILSAYKPGVIVHYSSDDIIITRMNNYPTQSLDTYAESFKTLLKIFEKSFPKNFSVSYVRAKEQYDEKILHERIDRLLPKYRASWKTLSLRTKEADGFGRSPRNIMWKGQVDLSGLSSPEKNRVIEESKIIENAYYEADASLRGDYLTGHNHIPIVLSWGLAKNTVGSILTLGSTHSSVVDFWVGRGILEDRGDTIIPRILSKIQYTAVKGRLTSTRIHGVPMNTLQTIEIYRGELQITPHKGAQKNHVLQNLTRLFRI